jgi:threonine/homoserine/homoserine lactone efflux protein
MSPEFLLTTLILVVTPGIGVLYTVAAGLARGAKAGVLAAFACTLGILPHVAAAITGLAALLHTSAVAFQVVKYLGVAYLLYMAWSTFRDRGALTVEEEDATPRSAREVIVSGVLVNILNPKLSIFFVAFLPQFVESGSPALPQLLALSAVFMGATFVVFAGYGLFAAAIRQHVISRPQVLIWMRRVFGGAFLALGAKLAATQR